MTIPACAARGAFNPNASHSWDPAGTTDVLSAVGLSPFVTDKLSAQLYGLDNVGLGSTGPQSPVLAQRTVAGMDSKDFFMALFGLSNTDISIGTRGRVSTFLSAYRNNELIASNSFSYTAGAYGRNKTPPSLILGGYDRSRVDLSKTLEADIRNTTTSSDPFQFPVHVDSIVIASDPDVDPNRYSIYRGSEPLSIDSDLTVYIDPVIPQLRLPLSVCDGIAKAFRLVWNETAQLYLMNQSTHDWFIKSNMSIVLSLYSSPSTRDKVSNFTLTSSAFDLRATWPLVETESYYFPLKRATGTYILGRTFLQDTHITVDYGRGNFTLSQGAPWTGQAEEIITILSPSKEDIPATGSTGTRLSNEAYGGIGVAIFLVIAIGLLYCWRTKRWPFSPQNAEHTSAARQEYEKAELHGTAVPWVEAMGEERAELETEERRHEVIGAGDVQGELPGSDTVYELDVDNSTRGTVRMMDDRQER